MTIARDAMAILATRRYSVTMEIYTDSAFDSDSDCHGASPTSWPAGSTVDVS
jgi:hypothetical protein